MKLFLMLLGMAFAGVAGYLMEPSLRFQLTGIEPNGKTDSIASTIESMLPKPGSDIDPATLTPEQLPEKITLSDELKFSDASSGLTITVSAGSRAKLIRIDGKNAVVRPGDTAYTIVLPIEKTDLMAQLAANPPAAAPPIQPAPEPAPAAEPAPEPVPAPAGDSEEPAPMPAPATEPTPAMEPAPAPAAANGATDAVKIMQESIRGGQVKEFTFDQVLNWEAGAEETVDGEAFKTGTASYKAETIFGVKTIQAKALIKEGKVQRWIWPKSGMEIK